MYNDVVKKIMSFQGLGQLKGVVHNRMHTRVTEYRPSRKKGAFSNTTL